MRGSRGRGGGCGCAAIMLCEERVSELALACHLDVGHVPFVGCPTDPCCPWPLWVVFWLETGSIEGLSGVGCQDVGGIGVGVGSGGD
jgi:hypothetical protein